MEYEDTSGRGSFAAVILNTVVIFGLFGAIVGSIWGWALGFNIWIVAVISGVAAAVIVSFASLSIAVQPTIARQREMSFARNMMFTPLFLLCGVLGLIVGIITQVLL